MVPLGDNQALCACMLVLRTKIVTQRVTMGKEAKTFKYGKIVVVILQIQTKKAFLLVVKLLQMVVVHYMLI